jgi:DNA-binding response OmpR family regulator
MADNDKVENKMTVLLVDDDKFLLDMYSTKFSQHGFVVHAALSVKNALETLRGGFKPEAVVFDLIMPEENGFSLLEKIKNEKLAPGVCLIALSNQSDETEKKRAIDLGATRYIVKASMIPSEVVEAVEADVKARRK